MGKYLLHLQFVSIMANKKRRINTGLLWLIGSAETYKEARSILEMSGLPCFIAKVTRKYLNTSNPIEIVVYEVYELRDDNDLPHMAEGLSFNL